MKYIEIRKEWNKKVIAAAAVGAFAFAPLFGAAQPAQADPPDHAPAHGWRRKNGDDRRNNDRNRIQRYTVTGIVTNDFSGNGFTMRTNDGRTVRVQTNQEPSNLSTGDRVTVYGYNNGSVFVADSVRVVGDRDYDRDDDWNRTPPRYIAGVVTNDFSGNGFTMRTNDGRTVRVQTNSEPDNLSAGDRVTVYGYYNGDVIVAERVRVSIDRETHDDDDFFGRNGRDSYPRDYDRRDTSTLDRTVTGVVTRDFDGRTFEVRTTDGRRVTVRARNGEPDRLSRGDQVTVQGRYSQNREQFIADSVRIVRDNDITASRVSFPATVTAIDSNTRLRVRGDNGRTYTVNTRSVSGSNLRVGDRVRIGGTSRNGLVNADRIQVVDRNNVDPRNRDNDNRIEFTGTVVTSTWMGQQITVRRDDGKQFGITVPRGSGSFRNGDRVRVVGWKMGDGRVQASSINRF